MRIFHRTRMLLVCRSVLFVLIALCGCSSEALAQWTTSGNDISNSNSGNVGVKTTAPEFPLQVNNSSANVLGVVYTGTMSGTAGSGIQALTSTGSSAADQRLGFLTFGTRNAGTSYNAISIEGFSSQAWTLGSAQGGYLTFSTTANGSATRAERMRISHNGNVGIGTTNPADALHIHNGVTNAVGTIRLQGGNNVAGFLAVWDFGPMLLLSNNRHPGTANNFKTTSAGSQILIGAESAPGDIGFYTTSTGTTPTYTELVRMKANGRVGIGTITPGYQLDVQGGSINSSGGLCIAGDCKTAWSQVGGTSSQWTTTSSNIYYNTGNVGVGTTNPTSKLFVGSGTPAVTTLPGLNVALGGPSYLSASNGVQNMFMGADSNGGIVGTLSNHAVLLRTNNSERMRIDTAGNVGIGTVAPTERLEISGNLKVSGTGNITAAGTIDGGNIKAKYQDLAEWVESSQELRAGMVVVLDSSKSNQVIASTSAYDSRVAGVISLQPGIALGEYAEGRVLVATMGRVKVKVDATRGPIQIGDLLVTSDREGVAMKSVPVEIGGVQIHRPGTLIGKALEPLAKGTGEILVLLSLQ